MIPPQELRKKNFNRAVRGYDPAEVDQYFELLVGHYTEIYKQCEIYDKKLKIVAQKIVEIQEREENLHNKEETIGKTMMSSQEIHDRTIEEARNTANQIVAQAEASAEQILLDARERAQKAFAAVDKKTEEQISSAREKSESLYLATRTRCAKLLGDFKKEIGAQRDRMFSLKESADDFAVKLGDAYKTQFDMIKSSMIYVPAIDFEKLTETRLFNMIMEEIKDDMVEIEDKNGDAEYEFEKELALLRNFDFVDDRINKYKLELTGVRQDYSDVPALVVDAAEEDGTGTDDDDVRIYSGAADDSDVKVFAGSVAATNVSGQSANGETDISGTVGSYDIEYDNDNGNGNENENEYEDEEPISTYDSDDYEEKDYSNPNPNADSTETEYYDSNDTIYENEIDEMSEDEESDEEEENEIYTRGTDNGDYNSNYSSEYSEESDDEDESSGGILGFFKGFGKKKKKNTSEPDDIDDIDDIYNELDDDEVMDIFAGFDDDEER